MKKFNIMTILAALCLLIPALTSCDKDDDPTNGDAIQGSYTGTLGYSVMGFDPGEIDGVYEVKIVKDASNADKVTVVLPECSFTPPIPQARPFTIASLYVSGVDVTLKDNKYTFKKESFSITVDEMKYEGSNLEGTVNGNKIESLHYNLKPGGMPMDIVFSFTGTRK